MRTFLVLNKILGIGQKGQTIPIKKVAVGRLSANLGEGEEHPQRTPESLSPLLALPTTQLGGS